MKIEIAPLRLDEAEALVDLAGRIWRTCYPGIVTPEQIEYMLAQRYKPGLVRQLLARGDLWLAARREGRLVGYAHAHPLEAGDYKLDKLYVDADLQHQGIGGRLLDTVADRARGHGFTRLVLRVNRGNQRAIDAYLKHGFTVATLVVEDIGGGFVMDDYVMVKDLLLTISPLPSQSGENDMRFQNPGPEDIKALLARVRTIAVVGLSPKPDRPSFSVSQAMQRFGYRIVPVRPATDQILGEKAYVRLADIPFPVDLVNVFRESSALPGIVEECLAINAPAIWVQEGIVHDDAAEKAREAGLCVVMDRCIFKDYVALMG